MAAALPRSALLAYGLPGLPLAAVLLPHIDRAPVGTGIVDSDQEAKP